MKHEIVQLPDGRIDVDADPLSMKLLEIESLNKQAVLFLNSSGYDGNEFERLAPRKKKSNICVTVPLSRERQDALSNASTAGARFFATNGEHLTSEDFL